MTIHILSYTSSRLIYRAINIPEDLPFLTNMRTDIISGSQSNPNLPVPPTKSQVEEHWKRAPDRNLLTVVLCLHASSEAQADSSDGYGGGVKKGEQGVLETEVAGKIKNTPIGVITLQRLGGAGMAHHRGSSIGINIDREFHGKGYGTEAINWILGWGFRVAGMHRISIEYFTYNARAGKLYERMGFVYEGREREAMFFDGEWYDIVTMSLLEHEWRERETKRVGEKDKV